MTKVRRLKLRSFMSRMAQSYYECLVRAMACGCNSTSSGRNLVRTPDVEDGVKVPCS